MTDKIKIIQDISLLYELSLSVGSSLDARENCHHFLRTLISRKSLNFGSIWLFQPTESLEKNCQLFYIHPHFREDQAVIPADHFIVQTLASKPFFSLSSQEPDFEKILHEKKVGKGAYAFFRLGAIGFLKLFAANRPDGFTEIELAQLKQVVDKLAISLNGCFAHIQLKKETENRLVAQKALEESESKLRRIIDSSLDAVISVDDDGLIIEWSMQAEKMFGYTRTEALGQSLKALIIPERHQMLYRQSLREQLESDESNTFNKRYEIKCIRKNGHEFRAELSITSDKSEKNILFVGFLRDITEQQKAKLEIEQARIRMETLIANLQEGILLEDMDGKIALANKSFCSMFLLPVAPETLTGMECSKAVESAKPYFMDPAGFAGSISRAVQCASLVTHEIFALTDGRILERDYIPLFSNEKRQGHLWKYRDVTEQQNAQKAIRDSEEKYRGVLENMELGLLEVDTEDKIIRANNAFCQMLGYQPEELTGLNAGKTLLPEASKSIIEARLAERKMGQSSVYEIQLKRKNGDLIWGLISGAPVNNSQGQIVGSIGIQFDLTERKKLEQELAEAIFIAEKARLAERQFLAKMSHEIRTPINAVIGMTHLLYETRPTTTQKEYLDGLRFSADSLLGIVDNILDLSKIDANEIEFEQKPFDLAYLLKALFRSIQFKMTTKNILLIESIDPAIQNLVVGDPIRTYQILSNLLGNAIKFTEKGTISLKTKLLRHTEGRYWLEFLVHDTGIGIPEDKLDTIFEYFKQADIQINRKYGGTGLGLAIVKQLVEMQGGSIRVESRLGVGSDFIITLSFGDSGIPVSDQEILQTSGHKVADNQLNGMHLLIVEDNVLNQKLICKTIQSWGCTFDVAGNGKEALSKTKNRLFDLILMDIHMPELDGCETTLIIRNDPDNPNRDVPIVALTAAAMPDEKKRAFEVGMNDFLTKPIAPKMLQERIQRSIRRLHPIPVANTGTVISSEESDVQVDLGYLLDLSHGDLEFVQGIIDTFLTETPVALQNMEICVVQEDWAQVGKLAHQLKPNFAMFGMKKMKDLAQDLEKSVQIVPVNAGRLQALSTSFIQQAQKVMSQLRP